MKTRIELEACVAACVLMSEGKAAYHVDIAADDFELAAAKAVIMAARELQVIDAVLVRRYAETAGLKVQVADVLALLQVLPTGKNLLLYVAQLKNAIYQQKVEALRREFVSLPRTEDIIERAKLLQDEEATLAAIYLEKEHNTGLVTASAELINRIENRIDNADLIPTGWPLLDEMMGGGLLPNELLIIAARPSVGKTAAALQIALDCKKRVLLVSLEMSKAQISPRLLAAISLLNTKVATRQPSGISEAHREGLLASSVDLLEASERIVVIDDHDMTIDTIRRIARKEVEAGAAMVILDYLQLLEKKAESRERAVAQISRDLKNMAKELNVPVICLAQMNRSVESENRLPRLSDLRESGAIEQDANAVLFIHKTGDLQDGKKQVALIMAKGRDVGEGFRRGIFNADHQRFYAVEA
jgi:replicative DNA helicase